MGAKYHPGEMEVQERASVRPMVERLGSSIRATILPATREYSEERLTIVVGFVDADGWVWASLFVGEPGFVRALDERTVRIRRHAVPWRPVGAGPAGADSMVGVIAIDCTTRMPLNGEAEGHLDGIYVRAYH